MIFQDLPVGRRFKFEGKRTAHEFRKLSDHTFGRETGCELEAGDLLVNGTTTDVYTVPDPDKFTTPVVPVTYLSPTATAGRIEAIMERMDHGPHCSYRGNGECDCGKADLGGLLAEIYGE